MDAQCERTDPFFIKKKTTERQAIDKTWKLSNPTTSVLTVREEESFGSSLGWLSLQLQLFSVHVNRKLWVDLEEVFGSAEPAFGGVWH